MDISLQDRAELNQELSIANGERSLLQRISSQIRHNGILHVLLGTLLATVFALRIVGRVNHSLFLWPVSAVATGLALRYWHRGLKTRVALNLAAATGFLAGAAIAGMPMWLAAIVAALDCLDMTLGQAVLGGGFRHFDDLKRHANILRFAILTIGVPVVSGVLGAYPIARFLGHSVVQTAATSILANSLGFAVILPVLLFIRSERWLGLHKLVPPYTLQATLSSLALVAVVSFIFWQNRAPFLFMIFPPMVFVLMTMGLEGAVFISITLTPIAWVGTSHGHGPIWLMRGTPLDHLMTLQIFVWTSLITALPIGALLDVRRRAEGEMARALKEKGESLEENRRLYASLQASNQLFSAFMSHGPFASYIKEADGSMVFYNKYLAERGGVDEKKWIGLKDDEIWPADVAADFRRHDLAVLESKLPAENNDVSPGPDGGRIFWKTLKFPYYDAERDQLLLAGISFDVTQDVLREAALEDTLREKAQLAKQIDASRHLLENFLHHNPTLTYVKDASGKFVFYNREVEKFFGISSTEWLGLTIAEVRPEAEALRYMAQEQQVLSSGEKVEDIDEVEDQNCVLRKFKSVTFSYRDIHGRSMLAKISQDITEQLKTQEELAEANHRLTLLAMTDSLTGLATRRVFEGRAETEFAVFKRNRRPLSILVMDIDNFKQRNDAFGHAVGDEALRVLGTVIAACVRKGDVAARIGGEEFALLLPDTNAEGALELAERFRSMLHLANHGPVVLTVSIGVSTFDKVTASWEEMLSKADEAMYEAKRNGKDQALHHNRLRPRLVQMAGRR